MFSQIIVLIVLILLNAFFASTEIAFISLNDNRIAKKANEGDKKAKSINKMLQNPSKFLATIQIGITLAGFLSSAFASEAFASRLAVVLDQAFPLGVSFWTNVSIIVITIILSYFSLVFGELVPKRIAMKYSEKVAYFSIGNKFTLSEKNTEIPVEVIGENLKFKVDKIAPGVTIKKVIYLQARTSQEEIDTTEFVVTATNNDTDKYYSNPNIQNIENPILKITPSTVFEFFNAYQSISP